jgi:hypothetical protein
MPGMKLNELVCPTCGLRCLTDASYTTCASCNAFFYANQSRSVDNPLPLYTGLKIVVNPVSPSEPVQPTIDITPDQSGLPLARLQGRPTALLRPV